MKLGRNDPCHCGSGKKYKHCCYALDSVKHEDPIIEAPEQADDADSTDEKDSSGGDHHHTPHRHNSGRARFQGGSKSGGASFRPNLNRGGQRGS